MIQRIVKSLGSFAHSNLCVELELLICVKTFCVSDKDRELIEAHNEIKALRLTERAKEKALAMVM